MAGESLYTRKQLLDEFHRLYGTPRLNTICFTENFSGGIVKKNIELFGDIYQYNQDWWNGKLTREYITDRNGYAIYEPEDAATYHANWHWQFDYTQDNSNE